MPSELNGAGAVQTLHEVTEADASPAISTIFDDVRATLRVPFVDQLWRLLASMPDFLEPAWRWLEPLLGSVEAERAADKLRREAVIPLAFGLPAHKAFRGDMSRAEIAAGDRERISNFNMASHYVLPKLLLAAALLQLELRRNEKPPEGPFAGVEPLQRGVTPDAPKIDPMDPNHPSGEAVALFPEIRARHGYAEIADYYRSIARAGDFLRVSWNALRPVVGDPEYFARARAVADEAERQARHLRTLVDNRYQPLIAREQLAPIAEVLALQKGRLLPEMLVEQTIIKGLTDGPELVHANRYSLTDPAVRRSSGM